MREQLALAYLKLYSLKKTVIQELGLEHWDPMVEEDKKVREAKRFFIELWMKYHQSGGDFSKIYNEIMKGANYGKSIY